MNKKCPHKKCLWYREGSYYTSNCRWAQKPKGFSDKEIDFFKNDSKADFFKNDSKAGTSTRYQDCCYYKEQYKMIILKEIENL